MSCCSSPLSSSAAVNKVDADDQPCTAQTGAQLLTFKATANNVAMLSDVKVRNFSFKIDEPEALGGSDLGANPVEYVLGALVA